MRNVWGLPTDPVTVARRAGGRRRYNAWRQFKAAMRLREVAERLCKGQSRADIARALGVDRSTITRDVHALDALWREGGVCPVCGHERRAVVENLATVLTVIGQAARDRAKW